MAKTRLNMSHRGFLESLASDKVSQNKELSERSKANSKLLDEIAVLAKKETLLAYPTKDMKVLKKYKKGHETNSARFHFHCDKDGRDHFKELYFDGKLLLPNNWENNVIVAWEHPLHDMSSKFAKEKESINQDKIKKMRDYKALINNSRYFEDVVEVWEEAEELREKITKKNTALMVLSSETVKNIKQDVKERKGANNG